MTKNTHTFTRRTLGSSIFVAGLFEPTHTLASAAKVPRILFVCQYGSVKSAIARELFRRRARERGINARAVSRGITPEDHVSKPLQVQLASDNLDTSKDRLQVITLRDMRAADYIIVFNRLPNEYAQVPTLDWSSVPSATQQYDSAKADMMVRINALLDEIATR